MKNKILTLIALLILGVSFSQEMKIYLGDNYSIIYPLNWDYSSEKPNPSNQFVLVSEESSAKTDNIRENINLTTESLRNQKITLEEYIKISSSKIKSQIPKAKIVSKKDIILDGIPAKAIEWSVDFGNNRLLKFKQYTLLHENTAYILTFTSSYDEYSIYLEEGTKILNSFKFIN